MKKITAAKHQRVAIELVDESANSAALLEDMAKDATQRVIYKSPSFKGGKKWISVIETMDKNGSPFYHAQRLGKDSVAFLCYSCLLYTSEAETVRLRQAHRSISL